MNKECILDIKNINKKFSNVEAVKDFSYSINKGDTIAIIGSSGSGKTTLLRCLNFLEAADSGSIVFDNHEYNLQTISKKEISSIRKKTAFVFQTFNLFANKTALENVIEGLVTARKVDRKEATKKGKELLDKVGLSDKYDAYPSKLSGGQKQRVAIARALATDPEIIYFDEPTSALDPELINEVLNVMKQLSNEKRTMLVVTHELNFARDVSDYTIFLENGMIVESGKSKDLFANPQKERTKEFLRNYERE